MQQAYEYRTHFERISYETTRRGVLMFKQELEDHSSPLAADFAESASAVLCRFGAEGWALVSTEAVWAMARASGSATIDGANQGSRVITGYLFFLQRPRQA